MSALGSGRACSARLSAPTARAGRFQFTQVPRRFGGNGGERHGSGATRPKSSAANEATRAPQTRSLELQAPHARRRVPWGRGDEAGHVHQPLGRQDVAVLRQEEDPALELLRREPAEVERVPVAQGRRPALPELVEVRGGRRDAPGVRDHHRVVPQGVERVVPPFGGPGHVEARHDRVPQRQGLGPAAEALELEDGDGGPVRQAAAQQVVRLPLGDPRGVPPGEARVRAERALHAVRRAEDAAAVDRDHDRAALRRDARAVLRVRRELVGPDGAVEGGAHARLEELREGQDEPGVAGPVQGGPQPFGQVGLEHHRGLQRRGVGGGYKGQEAAPPGLRGHRDVPAAVVEVGVPADPVVHVVARQGRLPLAAHAPAVPRQEDHAHLWECGRARGAGLCLVILGGGGVKLAPRDFG